MRVESRALRRCSERSEGREPSGNIKMKVREINVRRAGLRLHNVGRKIWGGEALWKSECRLEFN